ncbi:peptide chain release factor N(5)-glutamine methyltransferase [Flavobacterium silvaticum]|uniref:Release factor glutamine methyltransferase n=1 Tax=Flavobacterium silvaticum TaxID=1852020 RepID=A0A972FMQ7_9FLAO|nr:peptide chain release factor N(5)-glutamine methyltransferase [Flavobacterium silvaticum]NMH28075.1 peptide chain release factor N(5)-glutamine methyltransferase [Flavobacterium silvaticum]
MNIRTYKHHFISELTAHYDAIEAENFINLLLEDWLGLKRIDVATKPELEFSPEEKARFDSALDQLKQEVPIQYIIGSTHFYGFEFEVNPAVLIPRQETEELVDWIVKDWEFNGNPQILDIGTGSGCIAISVAKSLVDSKVSAIDVSFDALETAKRNAVRNEASVQFHLQDILQTKSLDHKYDIIVSNPPYVRNLEKHEIRKNVLEYEPHLALFVDDNDALVFYRKIAQLAIESLSENGSLYFEINQYLASETIEMLENIGYKSIELRKDLLGNDRMLKASISDVN